MGNRLQDRTAIVTGAARGMGRAIAQAMAQEGAHVVINDVDPEETMRTAEWFKEKNWVAHGVVADISQPVAVRSLVNETMARFGSVEILVNNAGGALRTPRPTGEVQEKDWELVVNVNLKGAFLCCQAVIPYMVKQGRGSIVNISALAGRWVASLAGPQYTAAKAGLQGLTRHLAMEFGPIGIRVNAVAPGITLTGERVENLWNQRTEDEKARTLASIPLRRLARPEEIASVVVFLASDESSYITGATIDVNGGRFMV